MSVDFRIWDFGFSCSFGFRVSDFGIWKDGCVKLLSVLMPVYNERRTLRTIVGRVLASPVPIPFELIAVDDCSTDGSADILRELAARDPRLKPVFHEHNTGKGGAVHTAIKHMTGDLAIIQDADLEYNPAEIPRVIQPILDGNADAVLGSRFAGSDYRRVLYYWHRVANTILTLLTNMVADVDLTDMETCYKAVRADVLRQTCLRFRRFGLEPELTIRLAQWGLRIYEVPVSYMGRTYAEGKKIGLRDAIKAVGAVLWCGLVDRRFTTHDGYYTLTAVRKARGYNQWVYRQIRPYLGRRVLEAGCGIGNLTEQLLDCEQLTAADTDPLFVEMTRRRFGHLDNFRALQVDWTSDADCTQVAAETLDTVFCINVLEHVDHDDAVLRRFVRMVTPGGYVVALVPLHPRLYSAVDEALGHKRRYTAGDLRNKFAAAGLEEVEVKGFNRFGSVAWWLNGKVLRRKRFTPGLFNAYSFLLPLLKGADYLPLPANSALAVGRKRVPAIER
jgi:glycosyltransferase involved in cell wall biosynthesis